MSLQIIPIVPENEVYSLVDEVIKIIQDSGLNYVVGPMETTIEGDLDTLLELVKKAHETCIELNATRVLSVVKIDYKPSGVTIDEKIAGYYK